ncbi:MAG: DUF4190 domain-containing protein [Ruminococcaceae bacterium]|nr:DUF4190 domain-containing protein [Oscillospiraceae bacterium]
MEEKLQQETVQEAVSVRQPQKSALATAGMVLGIVGIATSFIPIVNNASFVLGILALIFGGIALVKKKLMGKAMTALVLGILSVVITLAMQAAMVSAVEDALGDIEDDLDMIAGEKTEDVLRDFLDVSFGSFQVISDEYWEDTKLEVTLKNKSEESKSFSVTVEAVNAEGNRISEDYIYVDTLGAGQSKTVDIFTLVTSDDAAKLKDATFRVVEASAY